jgi:hypothetical protein
MGCGGRIMHRLDETLQDLLLRVGHDNAAAALAHHPRFTADLGRVHAGETPVNPKARCGCGRRTQADMLVYHDGDYKCDGCWTALRRAGRLS